MNPGQPDALTINNEQGKEVFGEIIGSIGVDGTGIILTMNGKTVYPKLPIGSVDPIILQEKGLLMTFGDQTVAVPRLSKVTVQVKGKGVSITVEKNKDGSTTITISPGAIAVLAALGDLL